MLKRIPRFQETLVPQSVDPTEIIEYIISYIDKNACERMSVDLSFVNVIDTCYITTICSTKHFMKYPDGKISWKISSEKVKELNKDLELGNIEYLL